MSCEFGRRETVAVVQNRAAFRHIKEAVEVHGDTSGRWRCDLNERKTVCRFKNLRLVLDGGRGIREDLSGKGK